MKGTGSSHAVWVLPLALALVLISATGFISCGGTGGNGEQTPQEITEDGTRLPPGLTASDLEGLDLGGTDSGNSGEAGGQEADAPSEHSALLAGGRFTVADVTRNESNKKVIVSGQREVPGDYLEVELALENAGDDVIDLSHYSFRLDSPAIEAGDYRSYYGDVASFGRYVSDHVISAVLLDYADLTPALFKLKTGETLDGVFLFFDLNPKSTAKNEGFTLDGEGGAQLVIYKLRGSGSGEEIRIDLAAFAG